MDLAFIRLAMDLVHVRGAVYVVCKTARREDIMRSLRHWTRSDALECSPNVQPIATLRFALPATYCFHRRETSDIQCDSTSDIQQKFSIFLMIQLVTNIDYV